MHALHEVLVVRVDRQHREASDPFAVRRLPRLQALSDVEGGPFLSTGDPSRDMFSGPPVRLVDRFAGLASAESTQRHLRYDHLLFARAGVGCEAIECQ